MLTSCKYLLLFNLLLISAISCSEKETISEEEFVKIYVDILIAQDTTSDKSISVDSLKTIVLKKYQVTDSDYKKTIDHYNESPDKWQEFFEKAIKYVDSLKTKQGS